MLTPDLISILPHLHQQLSKDFQATYPFLQFFLTSLSLQAVGQPISFPDQSSSTAATSSWKEATALGINSLDVGSFLSVRATKHGDK